VNAVCKDGATPLYVAAEFGHVDVVKRLVQAGADLEAPFQTGATPLYIAAYKGHADVSKTLVKLGILFLGDISNVFLRCKCECCVT
jgi:ankyrin repeat protein